MRGHVKPKVHQSNVTSHQGRYQNRQAKTVLLNSLWSSGRPSARYSRLEKRNAELEENLSAYEPAGVGIRQDSEGRYCLNDLHRAAGGEKRHQPSNWLQNAQTKELIAELSTPVISGVKQDQPITVINGGERRGTYVCKELVYAYAMWISARFNLQVIRAYDAQVSVPALDPLKALNDPVTQTSMFMRHYTICIDRR